MKPFDLSKALAGEPLVTRDGRKVTNFTQIGPMSIGRPFAAYCEEEIIRCFTKDGKCFENHDSHDLFMAPKPKKKLWIAVKKSKEKCGIGGIHLTSNAFESESMCFDYQEFNIKDIEIIEIEIEIEDE